MEQRAGEQPRATVTTTVNVAQRATPRARVAQTPFTPLSHAHAMKHVDTGATLPFFRSFLPEGENG